MVRFELKPCNTTSVEYLSTPDWSVHLRVCNWPSMYTLAPFFRYCSAILHRPSLKITTRCHSVFSLRSPVALSRQVSDVATLRLAIGRPSWVRRISGSLPRFPTRMTLLMLPAIAALHSKPSFEKAGATPNRSLPLIEGPYTLAGAAEPVVPQVIPTYSIGHANVPDLFLTHFVPKRSAMWPQLGDKTLEPNGTFLGSQKWEIKVKN